MWRRQRREQNQLPLKDAVAKKVAQCIVGLQVRVAALLQRWERRCSIAQKKFLLLLFCVTCGSYCLYLLAQGVLGRAIRNESPIPDRHMQPIVPPLPVPRKDSVPTIR